MTKTIHTNIEIINIGDELLIGQVINTNASWLGAKLSQWGYQVKQITSIGDNRTEIIDALESAIQKADIIIITGGLGPTKDDITKKTLTDFFHGTLVHNSEVYEMVRRLFADRGLPITEINAQQAMVPDNCTVIQNNHGTAPGMVFFRQGKMIASIPGVPFEMKRMTEDHLIPMIRNFHPSMEILHKTIMTHGIGESFLADILSPWENALPPELSLAYLPRPGMVRLRITAKGDNKEQLQTLMNHSVDQLQQLIPQYIFSMEDTQMENVVANLLINHHLTISTAESCTGGAVASRLTSISGSSAYYKGSIVAYNNTVKEELLHVPKSLLTTYGAVSKQVVESMATNTQKIFQTDIAVAISGVAGPSGGSEEKPVGTVWISVIYKNTITSRKFNFGASRARNIEQAVLAALNMVRKSIAQ